VRVSVATAATSCIRPWTIGPSIGLIHGTATRMKQTGNAKCRTATLPPQYQIARSVRLTTTSAWIHESGRQSGLATSKRRIGASTARAMTAPMVISFLVLVVREVASDVTE